MSGNDTGDSTREHLCDAEICGPKTAAEDLIQISADALPNYKFNREASHCFLYAKTDKKVAGIYNPRAAILMQVRSDGYIGFPGGIIEEGEDAVFSLNRELQEEMFLDLSKHSVKESDHVVSHCDKNRGMGFHFYALEVTLEELENIEARALKAKDYGDEVLGTIRVPLYTMLDGYKGFPVFLKHEFIENSRKQLLYTIKKFNLMTEQEISKALSAHK